MSINHPFNRWVTCDRVCVCVCVFRGRLEKTDDEWMMDGGMKDGQTDK